ncbi:hypothetical protein [Bacillus swezeyi]|uniref:hypothetical protein n=1 Tax=Bacillus swezeyi TaxID=1925020 RepID=UPI003F88FEB5
MISEELVTELQNAEGTAAELADAINPFRKSFLLATAKIDSVLIAAGKRFVERIK